MLPRKNKYELSSFRPVELLARLPCAVERFAVRALFQSRCRRSEVDSRPLECEQYEGQSSELYVKFEQLIGDHSDYVKNYTEALEAEVGDYGNYTEICDLDDTISKLYRELSCINEDAEFDAKYEEIRLLKARLEQFDPIELHQCRDTHYRLIEYHDCHLVCDQGTDIARSALQLLAEAPSMHAADPGEAPFALYRENTETAWRYVPDQQVRDYLGSKTFFNTVNAWGYRTGYELLIRASKDSRETCTIDVPTGLMVYAAGFDSWHGRGKNGRPDGDAEHSVTSIAYPSVPGRSINSIRYYAGLATPLPPVSRIYAYIQPDGRVFADNGSGDSHRIAAAMLRGDESVRAEQVLVCLLDRNLI